MSQSSISPRKELKVSLINPFKLSAGHAMIQVSYGGADCLEISLHRSLRIPNDGNRYAQALEFGLPPVFSAEQYQSGLPKELVEMGGLIVSIHNREAMWISFKSPRAYAINVTVGDVNAVSGEPRVETSTTNIRRKNQLADGKSIQDYLVSTSQEWLEDVASLDNRPKKFIPSSSQAILSGGSGANIDDSGYQTEDSRYEEAYCSFLRLIYGGKQLEDEKSLHDLDIKDGNALHLIYDPRRRHPSEDSERSTDLQEDSSSQINSKTQLNFNADPIPPESWDQENRILFNLSLVNATAFHTPLGIKTNTKVNIAAYKSHGFPAIDDYTMSQRIVTV